MQTAQHVSKTDLARNTHQVLKNIQRGRIAIIENHRQPEAAIIDINDYLLVRAVMRYYGQRPAIETEADLTDRHGSMNKIATISFSLIIWRQRLA